MQVKDIKQVGGSRPQALAGTATEIAAKELGRMGVPVIGVDKDARSGRQFSVLRSVRAGPRIDEEGTSGC
jgi:hypothetical protein